MNWRVFMFLVFACSVYLSAQDTLPCECCSSDEYYAYFYKPCNATFSSGNSDTRDMSLSYCNTTSNLQCGWSIQDSHIPTYQSHSWSQPSYSQQALIASIYLSWDVQNFAHEIERSINYCMAYGYSRQQAEVCFLEQHALYIFPNFIINIKKFDGYRSYIRNLHQKLLNNQGDFYRLRKALGCVNRGYLQLLEIKMRNKETQSLRKN